MRYVRLIEILGCSLGLSVTAALLAGCAQSVAGAVPAERPSGAVAAGQAEGVPAAARDASTATAGSAAESARIDVPPGSAERVSDERRAIVLGAVGEYAGHQAGLEVESVRVADEQPTSSAAVISGRKDGQAVLISVAVRHDPSGWHVFGARVIATRAR